MSFRSMSRPMLYVAAAGVAASSVGLGTYVWYEQARPPILEIFLFSLKGAPVIFIRTPEDKRILVNGGADSEVIKEITQILPFYSRRIDTIIATKDDADHVSGLIDVVSRYLISDVYVPGVTLKSLGLASSTDPAYQVFVDKLNEIKVTPQSLKAGDSISFDSQTRMDVLFPATSSDFAYSNASAPEVLFKIRYGSTSFTFLGNATAKIQKFIASTSAVSFNQSDSNILFIPQSITLGNISSQLIQGVNPSFLIYSQSPPKNSPKAVKASSKKKIEDPISDIKSASRFNLKELGGIKITSDGETIQIKSAP